MYIDDYIPKVRGVFEANESLMKQLVGAAKALRQQEELCNNRNMSRQIADAVSLDSLQDAINTFVNTPDHKDITVRRVYKMVAEIYNDIMSEVAELDEATPEGIVNSVINTLVFLALMLSMYNKMPSDKAILGGLKKRKRANEVEQAAIDRELVGPAFDKPYGVGDLSNTVSFIFTLFTDKDSGLKSPTGADYFATIIMIAPDSYSIMDNDYVGHVANMPVTMEIDFTSFETDQYSEDHTFKMAENFPIAQFKDKLLELLKN